MNHLQRSLTLIAILISSTQLQGMLLAQYNRIKRPSSLLNVIRKAVEVSYTQPSKGLITSPALQQQYKALQETKNHTQHQLYNVLDKHGRIKKSSPLYHYLRANLSLHEERCNFLAQGIASLREAGEMEDAMHYRGYRWQVIKYDPTKNIVQAQISGIAIADAHSFSFQANKPCQFVQAFHGAVDTYIKQCNEVLNAG